MQWWPNHHVSENWLAQGTRAVHFAPILPSIVTVAVLFYIFYYLEKHGNVSKTSSYLHVIIHQMCCDRARVLYQTESDETGVFGLYQDQSAIGSNELGSYSYVLLLSCLHDNSTPTRT